MRRVCWLYADLGSVFTESNSDTSRRRLVMKLIVFLAKFVFIPSRLKKSLYITPPEKDYKLLALI